MARKDLESVTVVQALSHQLGYGQKGYNRQFNSYQKGEVIEAHHLLVSTMTD